MSVNVNRSVSDQFYRYKMPRLIAKVTSSAAVSRRGKRGQDNTCPLLLSALSVLWSGKEMHVKAEFWCS